LGGGKSRLSVSSLFNCFSIQHMSWSTPRGQVTISFHAYYLPSSFRLLQISVHKLDPYFLGFPTHSGSYETNGWHGVHGRGNAKSQAMPSCF
jgi:hypothetical protein